MKFLASPDALFPSTGGNVGSSYLDLLGLFPSSLGQSEPTIPYRITDIIIGATSGIVDYDIIQAATLGSGTSFRGIPVNQNSGIALSLTQVKAVFSSSSVPTTPFSSLGISESQGTVFSVSTDKAFHWKAPSGGEITWSRDSSFQGYVLRAKSAVYTGQVNVSFIFEENW
jgi:hypothetical protein